MTGFPITTVRNVPELRARVRDWRSQGERIALVPTMGALHEGHLSLVRRAKEAARRVVVSVFVNPAQFAPGEDFETYPRDESGDAELLASVGCDLLYAPAVAEIYPDGFATTITVAGISDDLEGRVRPGHFAGVATVVAKLLLQAGPDVAVFGEKDYQQLQLIRRLVRDLDIPVEIIGAPTVRTDDGLARSSRNAYLSKAERDVAARLNLVLARSAGALAEGADISSVETEARQALLEAGFEQVDYVEVRGADDLRRLGPGPAGQPARLLAAARLGRTRLIDNIAV